MSRRWWSILVLVALVAGVLWLQGNDATVQPTADRPGVTATDDAAASLPPEAVDTIALIDAGGPFPYRRDGAVFENREGRLPEQARGYWREYTVPTPGEDDRGARRLVEGRAGELFYTDDHYASFRQVREPV